MAEALTELTPIYGPFFGVMGAASAMIFSGMILLACFTWEIFLVTCQNGTWIRQSVGIGSFLFKSALKITFEKVFVLCNNGINAILLFQFSYRNFP